MHLNMKPCSGCLQVIQGTAAHHNEKTAAELAAKDASIAEEPLRLPDISGTWIKVNDRLALPNEIHKEDAQLPLSGTCHCLAAASPP